MFYVKTKLNENAEIRVEIDSENVFNYCPKCGEEVVVDLSEVFSDGTGDLYNTSVCCAKCSALQTRDDARVS